MSEDSRLVELAAVNCRLKTVTSFLKSKHTSDTLNQAIANAQNGLRDSTPMFVHMESVAVEGTRRLHSLMQLAELLETKATIGNPDRAMDECATLLERKIRLIRQIHAL